MRWRPTLLVLHRDVGFLCLGLTLAYAVSGIAVNHKHDWDYNRATRVEQRDVGRASVLLPSLSAERKAAIDASPAAMSREEEHDLIGRIAASAGRDAPKNAFWRGPDRIQLYYGSGEADVIDYTPSTGALAHTQKQDRWLLRDLNFLHLNEARGIWTYVADGYAALLLFLAVSGAVIVRGRRGLAGRGGVLVGIGLAVPLLAVLLVRYF
jgi:hypothetical protein